ncbi:unnamed protein product [Ambrosiozyma monospora]|uniref:Unnamed protein product n=1 Tax=Ambrosiozyma monospora TaxID=43982 RepID=A0ACB5T602_AMBMO|nr:unnamed protein product [Ambrosiozyma monospora]
MENTDLEVILKRLYGRPDVCAEKKEPIKFLEFGAFFEIPDMIQTTLLYSRDGGLAKVCTLIKYALAHDYGDHFSQCLSDYLDLLLSNHVSTVQTVLSKDPEMTIFYDNIEFGRCDWPHYPVGRKARSSSNVLSHTHSYPE